MTFMALVHRDEVRPQKLQLYTSKYEFHSLLYNTCFNSQFWIVSAADFLTKSLLLFFASTICNKLMEGGMDEWVDEKIANN